MVLSCVELVLNGFEQVAGFFGLPWVFVSGFFGLAQHEEAVFFASDHSEKFAVVADALWKWFVVVSHRSFLISNSNSSAPSMILSLLDKFSAAHSGLRFLRSHAILKFSSVIDSYGSLL